MSKYGYDPGRYQNYENVADNEKFFGRLDWNISKNHRFSIRYNQVESNSPRNASTSTGSSGVAAPNLYSANRGAITAMQFSNSNYYQAANLYSGRSSSNPVISGLKSIEFLFATLTNFCASNHPSVLLFAFIVTL